MQPSEAAANGPITPTEIGAVPVGIVVVTNTPPVEVLELCLDALIPSLDGLDTRVWIVDNGGRAPDRIAASGHADDVDLISTDNDGFGAAVNTGFNAARAAGAEVLVCLNDDVIVEPGWLQPLIEALAANPRLGGVQPLMLSWEGDTVTSAGVTIDEFGQGADTDRGSDPAAVIATTPDSGVIGRDAISAGAAAYARNFIDDVGDFDERFFLYYEDVELCRRGAAAGWTFGLVPASSVRHYGSASTQGLGVNRVVLQERNRLWDAAMWGSRDELLNALWLSARRMRHAPRRAHARALVASLEGLGPRLLDRRRPRSTPRPDWSWVPHVEAERRAVNGVNVVGFHHVTSGLANVARDFVLCLREAGVNVVEVDDDIAPSPKRRPARPVPDVLYPTTISFLTPAEWISFRYRFPMLGGSEHRMIGYWFWELETIPQTHIDALAWTDEVWTPTRFVRDAYAKAAGTTTPVSLIPLRFPEPSVDESRVSAWRSRFGDEFVFLVSFDYYSFMERKNPAAAIRAFAAAHRSLGPSRLIVKSLNRDPSSDRTMVVENLVAELVAADPTLDGKIEFIDDHLDDADHFGLIAAVDCYISPHRSEGLGLQPADAMWLGTPVISTNYGGVVDYLSDDNAWLVDYDLIGVVDGGWIYPDGAPWADIDHEGLTAAMIDVATNPTRRAERIARARADLATHRDPATFGRIYKDALESIDAYRFEPLGGLPLIDFDVTTPRWRQGVNTARAAARDRLRNPR